MSFLLIDNLLSPARMLMNQSSAMAGVRDALERVDGVIVRQSRLGWLAAAEAQRRGIPWAVEVVSDTWDAYWNYGRVVAKLYAPFAWWDARRWIGRANSAIYVTHEHLQRRYPCRGRVSVASNVEIHPVDRAVLDEKLARWRSESPDSTRKPVVGLIGSMLNRHKGLHVALRALRRLADQGTPLPLRVLGDGRLDDWRQEARRQGVADLLHLDGCLPNGEPVMRWLDRLDIYIQPSVTEGLPRALIEAMSRGLPAMGSTCGGIPELLPNECLHAPGDSTVLANQLARMATDRDWRIRHAERNYVEARNYYRDRLEAQRDAFWSRFADEIATRKRAA
ncbi:MAG: glycosyltransferase [Planctomycetia bacterium]|nr:glycosyltransferase [Planctomycetia bacterium]